MPRFDEVLSARSRSVVQPYIPGETEPAELGQGITPDEAETSITNYEGAPAFERETYERTAQVLTTNTLSETFYESQEELVNQTLSTLEAMRKEDPEFLAKALVYARNEGYTKLAPTVGLAELSRAEDKTWFRKAFPRVIQTPDDLREFVGTCKSGAIRKGFGGVAVDATKDWLQNLSEYHALKYSSNAKTKGEKKNMSLRDVVRMARPKPNTPELEQRLAWLVKRDLTPEQLDKNPQLQAYETFKRATTDEERVALIAEGKLPWEVVVPAVPEMTPKLWEALMGQMPYLALLRNINTLRRHGVLEQDANVETLVTRLINQRAIEKSKVLPFRFYDAYLAYTNQYPEDSNRYGWDDEDEPGQVNDSRITAALEAALEASFVNLPDIDGTIAIASDVSGSMSGRINAKGKTRYIDICGVMTGALLKKATGRVHTLPFEGKVVDLDLSGQDRILKTTKKLAEVGGGSTALGAPIQRLLDQKQSIDTFIGITDNVDWAYDSDSSWNAYRTRGSFLNLWRAYRETVNPTAQAFLLRIDPYKESVAPTNEPGVHFLYGWSDKIPAQIAQTLKGQGSQVDTITAIEL